MGNLFLWITEQGSGVSSCRNIEHSNEKKTYRVGIIGATGMVGQRFTLLLKEHPWFKVTCVAASSRSAGKPYAEAVAGRWAFPGTPVPPAIGRLTVLDAADVESVARQVDFVFCAVDMKKEEIRALEERYAKAEVPVISNNSANRHTPDVPMLIPEINGAHAAVIEAQRRRLGTRAGFIAVKPNCSIQSYVPALWPLLSPRRLRYAPIRPSAARARRLKPGPR